MSGSATYDLAKVSDGGVQAILDALRLDRDNVLRFELDEATGALTVETRPDSPADHVAGLIAGLSRNHRRFLRKIAMRTEAGFLIGQPIDQALADSGDLQFIGRGLTGLRGEVLSLFRFFEREFRRIAREFEAEDNHYPVMMPSELLAEVGYFTHFPQHVTLCSHLPDSLPLLESVSSDVKDAAPDAVAGQIAGKLAAPDHALIPGVCLPCYRQQQGRALEPGQVRTLTMQNHVFRYEADNFRPLARGWDFSVRDIVFFGPTAEVERLREAVMARAMELCEALDLEASLELASDPFFLDVSRDKAVYQRMGEVKYELLLPLPGRKEALAVSSFNLHRDFYTGLYDVRHSDGAMAESACMGFGLERWLYGFLSQKGLARRNWPDYVVSRLR